LQDVEIICSFFDGFSRAARISHERLKTGVPNHMHWRRKTRMLKAIMLGGSIAAAIGLAGIEQGFAHGKRSGSPPEFSEFDANGDGAISRDELAAFRQSRFDEADSNGDGVLSREELLANIRAGADKRVDRMIERRDADGDGALSIDETVLYEAHAERMFGWADADDDGAISAEEYEEVLDGRKGHRRGRWGRR